MEGSENEEVFDSLGLNPRLFINSTLNMVDELIEDAFDCLHKDASTRLKIDASDRAEELTKGLDYTRNTIQSSLDEQLSTWEKFSYFKVFSVPEGFSLPKDDEASASDLMEIEAVGSPELDAQLDSLISKHTLAEQENAKLKSEIQALERQAVISNHQAASINELLKLSEQISNDDAFKELQKLSTELSTKMERFKSQRQGDIQHARMERLRLQNGDVLKIIGGNGLSKSKPEDIEGFLAALKPV